VERAKMSVAINISNEAFMNEKVNPVDAVFIFSVREKLVR